LNRSTFHRLHVATLAGLLGVSLSALALDPGAKKPERRLPPTGSQTGDIPTGVDTGTPSTSNSVPLGTPVPPNMAVDRADQNKRSAAARAAARQSAASGIGPRIDLAPEQPTPLGAKPTTAGQVTSTAPSKAEIQKATTPPKKPSRRNAASGV